MREPSQREIQKFWDQHPVNADFFAGASAEDEAFFEAYDQRRQETEGHIREELLRLPLQRSRVLEIGLGHGTESQLLAERAAAYVGIDLTAESVRRVRGRFDLFQVPRGELIMMSGEKLGFADNTFDLVISHGVIHHSPRAAEIVSEIHRVLRPGGMAVVMLYHRNSLNYHISIRIVRRVGIFALALPGAASVVSAVTGEPLERVTAHTKNLRAEGLRYLRMENFIHRSTDGPHNIFSSVWSGEEAAELFSQFGEVNFKKHFLNERHLPGLKYLISAKVRQWLTSRLGWHLWIFASK